jgi:ABC-type phosphate transport system substrate-binding protein
MLARTIASLCLTAFTQNAMVAGAPLALMPFVPPPPAEYVLITHAANPVMALSRDQAAAYFLKRTPKWPDGRVVEPVDLPAESRVRVGFSHEVLRRSPSAVSAYWIQEIFAGRSEPPPVKSSETAVLDYVERTPGAIGYVAARSVSAGVHVLLVTP